MQLLQTLKTYICVDQALPNNSKIIFLFPGKEWNSRLVLADIEPLTRNPRKESWTLMFLSSPLLCLLCFQDNPQYFLPLWLQENTDYISNFQSPPEQSAKNVLTKTLSKDDLLFSNAIFMKWIHRIQFCKHLNPQHVCLTESFGPQLRLMLHTWNWCCTLATGVVH